MLPVFSGTNRPRQIDLGGSKSTYSQEALLDTLKAQREQRNDHRRRVESASKLQAWWRGTSDARAVREQQRRRFDDSHGPPVEWTRLLMVGWRGSDADWSRLGRWSRTVVEAGERECMLSLLSICLCN